MELISDKYLVYELKNKYIQADIPKRFGGYKIHGWVEKIYRDVIEKRIELTVGKKVYRIAEPNKIVSMDEGGVLFVYGTENHHLEDEDLFNELRAVSQHGGDVDRAFRNLEKDRIDFIRFEVDNGEKAKVFRKKRNKPGRPKKRGRKKGSRSIANSKIGKRAKGNSHIKSKRIGKKLHNNGNGANSKKANSTTK